MKKVFIFIIICVLLVLAVAGIMLQNMGKEEKKNDDNFSSNIEAKEKAYCDFNVFRPTYFIDPTHKFEYQDGIYYKKLNTFEEYSEIKSSWTNMLDMGEKDFEDKFMIITTIENTSMLGLTLDEIEIDEDTIYISLIKNENENEDDTSISIILPRKMNRENIICFRNFREDEKRYTKDLLIWYNTDEDFLSNRIYSYDIEKLDMASRTFPEEELYKYKPAFSISAFTDEKINKEDLEKLSDDIYYKKIEKFGDYVQYMNEYGLNEFSWRQFKKIGGYIFVSNTKSIRVNIETLTDENCLELYTDEMPEDVESEIVVVFIVNEKMNCQIVCK